MQKINGICYYTVSEVCTKTGIGSYTVHDYIRSQKIHAIKLHHDNTYWIPEEQVQFLLNLFESHKIPIVITKTDMTADKWLQRRENLLKLKQWGDGYHTAWAEMTTEELVKYWQYLILPQWKSNPHWHGQYPTKQWLMEHGFGQFKRAFEKRYFEKDGITTLSTFWGYLENRKN